MMGKSELEIPMVTIKEDGKWKVDLQETASAVMGSMMGEMMKGLGGAMQKGMGDAMKGWAARRVRYARHARDAGAVN